MTQTTIKSVVYIDQHQIAYNYIILQTVIHMH